MTEQMQTTEQHSPRRADFWQLRTCRLEFGRLPKLMGIVNVTPDSFSDGGQFLDPQAAVDHALRLADEGADILDIGGESTRPYSEPIDADEELRRTLPVVEALARQTDVPISIDTGKTAVAETALAAGAQIINDITGLEGDPRMLAAAADAQAGVCVMHMQGTPQTMQDDPRYTNVVEEIANYLAARRDALVAAGIAAERICLDPGIGFGKTTEHNLTLLRECRQLHHLGCPVLVGHSRKGFLSKIVPERVEDSSAAIDREAATVGVSLALALQGVQVLRVHDVRATRDALLAFEAGGGMKSLQSET